MNIYLDREERFLQQVPFLYEYLTGRYMSKYSGSLLDPGSQRHSANPMQIVRVEGYRKSGSSEQTLQHCRSTLENGLSAMHGSACETAWILFSDGRSVELHVASEINGSDSLAQTMRSGIPQIEFSGSVSVSQRLRSICTSGGVITGCFSHADHSIMDSIMDSMQGHVCAVVFYAVPVSDEKQNTYLSALDSLSDRIDTFEQVSRTFGTGSQIKLNRRFDGVSQLKAFLNVQRNRLSGSGIWETAIWVGAASAAEVRAVGTSVAGILSADAFKNDNERRRLTYSNFFSLTDCCLQKGTPGLPYVEYVDLASVTELNPALKKSALTSYLTTSELASVFQLPCNDRIGMRVQEVQADENTVYWFSRNVPQRTGDSTIFLGRNSLSGLSYELDIQSLLEHVLIAGAPGRGKTTTSMGILDRLYQKHIPFCVLEANKKEYWKLAEALPDLKVYSAGNTGYPLQTNLLEPEDGLLIGNHLDDLVQIFSGAFEMEPATRLALAGLLEYTFSRFGWKRYMSADRRLHDYPTVNDMLHYLPTYMQQDVSDAQTKAAIAGSVQRRLHTLNYARFCDSRGLTGKDLCNEFVLIELDDLSDDIKPFVTMVLMHKLRHYAAKRGETNVLKNVLLIEEAHSVFSKPRMQNDVRMINANRILATMLAVLRGLGVGILISNQGVDDLDDAAIRNTGTKIIHTIYHSADAQQLQMAMHLSRLQQDQLSMLPKGRALISAASAPEVCLVDIQASATPPVHNYGCLFCRKKSVCRFDPSDYPAMQSERNAFWLSAIFNGCSTAQQLRSTVDGKLAQLHIPREERVCALGHLLAAYPGGSPDQKRAAMHMYIYEGSDAT